MTDSQQTQTTEQKQLKKEVQQFYDEYHKRRNREIDDWMENVYWKFFEGDILEVGAGGRFPQEIIRKQFYVALDLSYEAAKQSHQAGVQSVIGDGELLPFADRSFDTVACYDVLEHITDPQAIIALMCRVSRHRVIFAGPNYVGRRYAPGLGRETLLSLWGYLRGDTRRWYRLDDFHLTYDDQWMPDHDAITAINMQWVLQEINQHGFKVVQAGTWGKRFPFLDKVPILRYLGFYMFVVAERVS